MMLTINRLNASRTMALEARGQIYSKVLQRRTTDESGLRQSIRRIGPKAILIEVQTLSINPVAKRRHTKGKVAISVK